MDENSNDPWQVGVDSGRVKLLSPAGYLFTGIYLTVLGVLAVLGNGLVFCVLVRKRTLRRKPHNMLLISMAASDLVITMCGYPFTTLSSYKNQYLFGWFYCILQGFITSLCAIGTMNTLVVISIYRYITVCKPQLKHLLTLEHTYKVLLIVWLYTLFWTVPPLMGWNSYTIEPFGTSCSMDWISEDPYDIMYIYCVIGLFYVVNTFIMAFCYSSIVKKSKELGMMKSGSFNVDEAKKHHKMKVEVKVTGMCLCLVLVYFIVWSPYALVSLWSVYDRNIPIWATTLPTLFAKLASMLNPFVYVATNTSFKNAARSFFCDKKNRVSSLAYNCVKTAKGSKDVYTIDKTKEGIYIGKNEVHMPTKDATFF
ncbi:opsin-5-like [Haliotis rufescens]|uniref:opsin-5-like n=1 Tax=Haliotis rufescens TaxID=6454 RepID=UPI001EB059AA|nr:opsin-5-like [Haliotis rufescens]